MNRTAASTLILFVGINVFGKEIFATNSHLRLLKIYRGVWTELKFYLLSVNTFQTESIRYNNEI